MIISRSMFQQTETKLLLFILSGQCVLHENGFVLVNQCSDVIDECISNLCSNHGFNPSCYLLMLNFCGEYYEF